MSCDLATVPAPDLDHARVELVTIRVHEWTEEYFLISNREK